MTGEEAMKRRFFRRIWAAIFRRKRKRDDTVYPMF